MVSLDGGSACKVDDVTALPSNIQDGGYALLWQRYDNNKMAAICYSTSSTVQLFVFFNMCSYRTELIVAPLFKNFVVMDAIYEEKKQLVK